MPTLGLKRKCTAVDLTVHFYVGLMLRVFYACMYIYVRGGYQLLASY